MVEIVKLAHPAKSGLQHFHIKLGGNGLHLLWIHGQRKAIHHRAPAPETIIVWPAQFRQTRHAALKGMAVQIGHCGQQNLMLLIASLRLNTLLNRGNGAAFQRQPHILGPAIRQ